MTATVGSLFAGVGGFDLGMERAGFTVLWQAEWDKHCQSVLRRHWPDSTLYGDVTDVNGAEIAPVDVVTFGSPCQDLSSAGKRAGLDGDRSSMFFQAIRIIKEMRDATNGTFPQIAVWENVPGSLSSNKGADFGVVLDALADLGAVAIEWAVLDARWFGVPQRRRRVFVVAVFDPAVAERCPDPLLPFGESRRRDSAKGKPKGKDVATSLADRVGGDSGERVNVTTGDVTGCLSAGAHPGGFNGQDAYTNQLIVESPAIPVLPGQQELFDQPFVKSRRAQSTTDHETWVEGDVAPTLNAFDNEPHIARSYSFDTQFGSNANVFTDLSPTLKATQTSPSVATEYAVRRLTPLECERLMGWGDDHTRWTDDGREQADSHRYRQCGNGVATPVAAWIGSHLLPLLEP